MRSAPVIGLFEELWRLEIASFDRLAAGKLIEVPTLGASSFKNCPTGFGASLSWKEY